MLFDIIFSGYETTKQHGLSSKTTELEITCHIFDKIINKAYNKVIKIVNDALRRISNIILSNNG